jgi:magnesium-transporting ATPase (P-type)
MTVIKIATDTIVEIKTLKEQALNSQYQQLMTIAVLCNDSSLEEKDGEIVGIGDPTETALIFMGSDFGIDKKILE